MMKSNVTNKKSLLVKEIKKIKALTLKKSPGLPWTMAEKSMLLMLYGDMGIIPVSFGASKNGSIDIIYQYENKSLTLKIKADKKIKIIQKIKGKKALSFELDNLMVNKLEAFLIFGN